MARKTKRLQGRALQTKATVSPTRLPASLMGYIHEPYAGAWQNGEPAQSGIGSLTSFGAVFTCIARISSDIAKLEPRLLIRDAAGVDSPAPSTSPFWEVIRQPNGYQNRIQFIAGWIVAKLMHGNFYGVKIRDARGVVYRIVPADARRVTPMVTPDGDVYYSFGGEDIAQIAPGLVLPASEVIHDRYMSMWHPLMGVAPITACAASIVQGLRIQDNSSRFFANMSRPSGMLTAPGAISEVTAVRLKKEWETNYAQLNLGRLAILGDGLKYEAMTIPAEDAQLIEQLGWTVEDVARCFNMPLYKINAGPVPTAGNVEALESQYYSGCLQQLIESLELCWTEGMKLPPGYHIELDLDGLLRMDSATKIDVLTKAVGGAIMAPNEARARMNLAPVKGGETPYLQQQNYSLAALAKRDEGDPFAPPPPPPAPPPSDGADEPDEPDAPDEDAAEAAELAFMAELQKGAEAFILELGLSHA